MSRLRLAVGSFLAAVLLFSAQVYAAGAPDTLGYQGRLTQNGVAVNGSVSVVFSLYAASSGGAVLWTETQSVTVASGLYSVVLGKLTPFPAGLFTQTLYLGIRVGTDAEMAQRQELTSTPYSQQAKRADSAALADSATTASTVSGSINGSQITGSLSNATVPGTAPWVATNAATQQAAANTGYVVTGNSYTYLTLPATPAVGDIVKVTSPSIGGFTVAPSLGQTLATNGMPRDQQRNWYSVAASADGSKLVAVVRNGQIYTSTDSGDFWNPQDSVRNWQSVASSADGSKLVAVVSGGQIYTSTDTNHQIWTAASGSPTASWSSIASSADGSKLVAVVRNGQIFTSTDPNHQTWTVASGSPTASWSSIASSADGSKLVAVVNGGQIYISTDTNHQTWTPCFGPSSWRSVASSADGSRLAVVEQGGLIYTSTDSGVNWTPSDSSGRNWWSIASSADGGILVAGVYGGQIYTWDNTFSGGQYSNVELVYSGGGKWTLANQQGGGQDIIANGASFNGYVSVQPPGAIDFGAYPRQMLNLIGGGTYGIGIQGIWGSGGTEYFRIDATAGTGGFAWYKGGVHSDNDEDPGLGGTKLMQLDRSGNLTTLGTVNGSSDRNIKEAFTRVDARSILAKVVDMPITSWAFKADPLVRHVGPMAQDFYTAFGIGTDDKHIATVDESGVALAAIQGLNAKVEAKDAALRAVVAEKDAQIAAQTLRINELEARVANTENLQQEVTALRTSLDDVTVLKATVAQLLRERNGKTATRLLVTD